MKQIAYIDNANPNNDEIYPVGENMDYWMKFIDLIVPKLLEIINDKPINVWCSGSSGAILAALLAKSIKNDVTICYTRKEGEKSHSMYRSRPHYEGLNIILDDFMRTGATIDRIYSSIICRHVDVMIIANCYTEWEWGLQFRPDYLIMDKKSIDNNKF